jgi:GT2 family glycosyltransferase
VEQPAGAFFMVRRAVWQELNGFDESFWPLWFEDVDFCRRMADRGLVSYYEPAAIARHTGGHSIPRLSVEMRHFYWYRSLLHYSAKHFRPFSFRAVCAAVMAGSVLRAAAEFLAGQGLKSFGNYSRVVSLASRVFLFGWRAESGLALKWQGPSD